MSERVEKGADADPLKHMIRVAQRMIARDVGALCGAGYEIKSGERSNRRNGDHNRQWQPQADDVGLCIHPLRSGSYFPPLLESSRTDEVAL